MPKLFLTSSFQETYQQLEEFSGESLEGKSVAFFDTASQIEEYSDYVDEAFKLFEKHFKAKPFRVDLKADNLAESIQNTAYIYVAGGNTFYLLQELKANGADKLIINHINDGKVYIGESAGSIIMSPDISYIAQMDDKKKASQLTTCEGLNLIDVYPLPHAQSEYLGECAAAIIETYQNKLKLVVLTDQDVLKYQ